MYFTPKSTGSGVNLVYISGVVSTGMALNALKTKDVQSIYTF